MNKSEIMTGWEKYSIGVGYSKDYLGGLVHASINWDMSGVKGEPKEAGYILHINTLTFKTKFKTIEEAQ